MMTQQDIDQLLRRNSELEAQNLELSSRTKQLEKTFFDLKEYTVSVITDATYNLKIDRRYGNSYENGRLEASAKINGFIDDRIIEHIKSNPKKKA